MKTCKAIEKTPAASSLNELGDLDLAVKHVGLNTSCFFFYRVGRLLMSYPPFLGKSVTMNWRCRTFTIVLWRK
jgi:hypothetical protein